VEGRNQAYEEARKFIHDIYKLPDTPIGNVETDKILSDIKFQLLKKSDDAYRYAESTNDIESVNASDSEKQAEAGEIAALLLTTLALPEERQRIKSLLHDYPVTVESKTVKLVSALQQIWSQNRMEKIVIFATYLGTVDAIKQELDKVFPYAGIDVLKGGDHGAKTAAQKRFKRPDGPKVLVCTAAGREGINLQFARILFNYDLPWNPMDLEQRIGRIHRYGQESTAQVYNLIATDTIEGQIFLLLESKLKEIALALGKVDENGQIAEDLRTQVLGQLGSALSYDRLYKEALQDPQMQRTRQELEVAMTNADLARKVVFELFQDLDHFNIGDYKKFDDEGKGMIRLINFISASCKILGRNFRKDNDTLYTLEHPGEPPLIFTSDRDTAMLNEQTQLIGLEHPIIKQLITGFTTKQAVSVFALYGGITNLPAPGLLSFWHITITTKEGQTRHLILKIGIDTKNNRAPWIESASAKLNELSPKPSFSENWNKIAADSKTHFQELLHRELSYKGLINGGASYSLVPLALFGLE
jgi:hypothetical protein